jgi:hypothetical protein
MRTVLFPAILAAVVLASAGMPAAQEKDAGGQPPAKQSAPAESPDAAGHDAQAGKPETAEKPNGQGGVKGSSEKPATAQSPPPAAMKPDTPQLTLTEDQAKSWIDKLVFSSDGKELGEVAEVKRGSDNTVSELHADIGGMLGIGETRISLRPAQFKLESDRVVLTLTEKQAYDLPPVRN